MGEKRTTSAECQTIRIAESSDTDDWEAIPRPMCKKLLMSNKSDVIYVPLYQRIGMEVVMLDQEGLWSY